MKARAWGVASLLVVVSMASSGCSLALRGTAVSYKPPRTYRETVSSSTTTPSQRRGLVPNGTFEEGTSPWQPMQYSRITETHNPRIDWTQGLIAAPTVAKAPWFGAFVVLGQPDVGATYLGHAWIRGIAGQGTTAYLQLFAIKRTAKGWVPDILGVRTAPLESGWKRLSVRGAVKSKATSVIELRIWVAGRVRRSTRLVVDGVGAKHISTPTPPHKKRTGHRGRS